MVAVCTVLASEAEVESVSVAWRDLHRRIGLAPFTDYDWAMAWWTTIGRPAGAKLVVVVCHDEGRLVGVLPFTVRITHGVRILRLLGHEVYYYRNFLIENPADCALMWQTVLDLPGYDFANLKNFHEGSPDDAFMATHATILHKSRVYYCLHHGEKREDLLADRSRAFLRKYRNVLKKLDKNEGITLGSSQDDSYDPALIDFLVRRKKQWTIERNKRGVFNENHTMDFYHAITRLGARQGILIINWMCDEGKPFAVTLNFTEKNVVYGHTLAIDLAYAKYMPGIFLNMEALIWASEHGYQETNYMEGEEEYKTRFAKHHRMIHEYACARTVRGHLFFSLYRLLRLYRALKPGYHPGKSSKTKD